MGRAPCCDKANVKRGPWSPEEDAALKSYIHHHGTGGNWIALPHKAGHPLLILLLFCKRALCSVSTSRVLLSPTSLYNVQVSVTLSHAGLKRCGKSCRLRWLNYLRPDIKHGGFTEEEDAIICTLYDGLGSSLTVIRWSVIASHLPGRTDNDVKNYWNTKLKKKLMAKQAIIPAHITTPPPPLLPTVMESDVYSSNKLSSMPLQQPLKVVQFPITSLIEQPHDLSLSSSISVQHNSSSSSDSLLAAMIGFGDAGELFSYSSNMWATAGQTITYS
ncbi:hypothetical protein BHM03_00060247 [Ensete ventricosum]|nr:hypothetical protein BHM03_00060247 [Ensete ventricosum]